MSHYRTEFEAVIRDAGHRVTPQRIAILDAVCEGNGHTTLGEIYARAREIDSSIDRSTVYRTLKLFVELGLIVSANIGDGKTYYEIAETQRHHHLVCRQCGKEQEIEDEMMRGMFDHVFQRYSFKADTNHLVLFGWCSDCLANTKGSD